MMGKKSECPKGCTRIVSNRLFIVVRVAQWISKTFRTILLFALAMIYKVSSCLCPAVMLQVAIRLSGFLEKMVATQDSQALVATAASLTFEADSLTAIEISTAMHNTSLDGSLILAGV